MNALLRLLRPNHQEFASASKYPSNAHNADSKQPYLSIPRKEDRYTADPASWQVAPQKLKRHRLSQKHN
jgi:hypothetical protein